jgi:hypothetical protein
MTRRRFRYDPDLDTLVEIGDNYFEPRPPGPYVMSDIPEYRTAAGDVAHDGKRVRIGSRSRHREFLRDNRYVEVGNDYDRKQVDEGRPRQQSAAEFHAARERRVEAIKRAADDVRAGRGYRPDPRDYE